MFDLGGADAVGHAGKGAMRAGVRVATDDRHAGQCRAALRADDMDDPLPRILERKVGQRPDLADVGVERLDLQPRHRVLDAAVPVIGRRVVVGGGDDRRRAPGLASGELQALEGLRAGDFVHQVAVDVDQRRAIGFLMDDVVLP